MKNILHAPVLSGLLLAQLCVSLPSSGSIPLTQQVTASTAFTASTAVAYQSMMNNPIIGLEIVVTGTGDPIALSTLKIDASLCTNFTNDVGQVKVFYTGSDSSFAATNLFWQGTNPSQPLTGNQELSPGKNYFWICYDILYYAFAGDTVDAAIEWFTLSDLSGTYYPAISSPEGFRLVASYIVVPRSITGRVYYDNLAGTNLSNVLVMLNSGFNVQQYTTGANGQYQFHGLMPGTYQIIAISYKPWGGVNSVDALAILRYFVGYDPLSPLQQLAADVDVSGFINATDALLVLRRFTGVITSFPAGDWVFEPTMVVIDGTQNVSRDIKGLCTGDVNRSYSP